MRLIFVSLFFVSFHAESSSDESNGFLIFGGGYTAQTSYLIDFSQLPKGRVRCCRSRLSGIKIPLWKPVASFCHPDTLKICGGLKDSFRLIKGPIMCWVFKENEWKDDMYVPKKNIGNGECLARDRDKGIIISGGEKGCSGELEYRLFYKGDERSIFTGKKLKTPRSHHSCFLGRTSSTHKFLFVVAGGRSCQTGKIVSSLEVMYLRNDGDEENFHRVIELKKPRVNSAVFGFKDRIYILGGESENEGLHETIEVYDIKENKLHGPLTLDCLRGIGLANPTIVAIPPKFPTEVFASNCSTFTLEDFDDILKNSTQSCQNCDKSSTPCLSDDSCPEGYHCSFPISCKNICTEESLGICCPENRVNQRSKCVTDTRECHELKHCPKDKEKCDFKSYRCIKVRCSEETRFVSEEGDCVRICYSDKDCEDGNYCFYGKCRSTSSRTKCLTAADCPEEGVPKYCLKEGFCLYIGCKNPCGPDKICVGEQCEKPLECDKTDPKCPQFTICNNYNNICEEAFCDRDSDCEHKDYVCHPESGRCIKQTHFVLCNLNAPCSKTNGECIDGECVLTCKKHSHCEEGKFCSFGICVSSMACEFDSDCPHRSKCQYRRCVQTQKCLEDTSICPDGELCALSPRSPYAKSYNCRRFECYLDEDCFTPGFKCWNGFCTFGSQCVEDSNCIFDHACVDGRCRRKNPRMICGKSDKCIPRCSKDNDCPIPMICSKKKKVCEPPSSCSSPDECRGSFSLCIMRSCSPPISCKNVHSCPIGYICSKRRKICLKTCDINKDCYKKLQISNKLKCSSKRFCEIFCTNYKDCEFGEGCYTGKCISLDCRATQDCPPFHFCYLGRCVKTVKRKCSNDEDCEYLMFPFSSSLKAQCVNSACRLALCNGLKSCADEVEICSMGKCLLKIHCRNHVDCPVPLLCHPQGFCVLRSCSPTKKCRGFGISCKDKNSCELAITDLKNISCSKSIDQCPWGGITCHKDTCKKFECLSSQDCGFGQYCFSGDCYGYSCKNKTTCSSYGICKNKRCVPKFQFCSSEKRCKKGYHCTHTGLCLRKVYFVPSLTCPRPYDSSEDGVCSLKKDCRNESENDCDHRTEHCHNSGVCLHKFNKHCKSSKDCYTGYKCNTKRGHCYESKLDSISVRCEKDCKSCVKSGNVFYCERLCDRQNDCQWDEVCQKNRQNTLTCMHPSCTSFLDCQKEGQVCVKGKCQWLSTCKNLKCVEGYQCFNSLCYPKARKCPKEFNRIKIKGSKICVPTMKISCKKCSEVPGWKCVRGKCTCRKEFCLPPSCIKHSDCKSDLSCLNGKCVRIIGCKTTQDCVSSFQCKDGFCQKVKKCSSNRDCPAIFGQSCFEGFCTMPICLKNEDCGWNEKCYDGVCFSGYPRCERESDCKGGKCKNGSCSFNLQCFKSFHCPANHICSNGICHKKRGEKKCVGLECLLPDCEGCKEEDVKACMNDKYCPLSHPKCYEGICVLSCDLDKDCPNFNFCNGRKFCQKIVYCTSHENCPQHGNFSYIRNRILT